MSESRSHKTAAKRIAKKFGVDYNNGKGVDIKSPRAIVEVETLGTVTEAIQQLRGHRGPVYIAGPNQDAVNKAISTTKGTTIGVMDNNGNVIKSSKRKR